MDGWMDGGILICEAGGEGGGVVVFVRIGVQCFVGGGSNCCV